MSYKSQERQDWENSPLYAVLKYRHTPQEAEDALDDFLFWLEYDSDAPEQEKDHLSDLKSLVDQFLGRSEKVHTGELELLERWRDSVCVKWPSLSSLQSP
jgi:hypothetical protein